MTDHTAQQPDDRPTREAVIAALRELREMRDLEVAHMEADGLLLSFIEDQEMTEAFAAIKKWYA